MPEVLKSAVQRPVGGGGRPTVAVWLLGLRLDFRLGYALLIPLVVACLASKSFLYDSPGHLDTNVYLGYFLHYSKHLPLFDDYYKISRLPWVLPGFASYQVLGPVVASFVLPVATMALALACLYLLLRDALDAGTALLGVVLLGACAWFHGVGGWNYHMTAATGYYLMTVLGLGRAAVSAKPRRWYFFSGVALALTVHTFVFMAAFVPGLILHCLLIARPDRRTIRFIALAVLLVLGGVAAATMGLGAINWASGGRFLFFVPIIKLILWLSKENAWYRPWFVWLPDATYLTLPLAALISCPLTWWFGKTAAGQGGCSRARVIAGFQGQLVWAVLACCYYQFVKHQTTLDYDYFAVCLLGPAVLSLCGFLYSVRDAWSSWSAHRVFAVAVVAIVVPFLVIGHGHWLVAVGVGLVVPVGLACSGLVCLGVARRSAVGFVAGLLLLGVANAESRGQPSGSLRQDAFRFNIEADKFATNLDPTLTDIKYWFDATGAEPTTGIFHSYTATRHWGANIVGGAPPPPLREIQAKHVDDFSRVAVLANTAQKEQWCRRVTDRFADLGIPLQFEAELDFHHGDISVSMVVYRIPQTESPSSE